MRLVHVGRVPPLPPHDRAQLLVAVYDVLDGPDVSESAERVRQLIVIARRFGVADAVGK